MDNNKITSNDNPLSREAAYLHYSLFKFAISNELKCKYIKAHKFVKPAGNSEQFKTIREALDLELDIEAIELVLRKKDSQHPLLQKIKILTYLTECDSKYYDVFINEKSSFFKGYFVLFCTVFNTAYKFLKGKILKWRYNLV